MNCAMPPSFFSWYAPAGSPDPVPSPAPVESSVTCAGMSATAQCQKPDWVGASGSYIVIAKLFVPSGAPDQVSCGEASSPPGTPNAPDICAGANGSPSRASALLRVKRSTSGILSNG